MLEQQSCERILAIMGTHSIEEKLKAIEDAKVMFTDAFRPGMSDSQWAYSAMVVEQFYNYIREILQVKQIRIKADLGGVITARQPKEKKAPPPAPKTKPNKYGTLDMSKLADSFSAFMALAPKKEESNGPSDLIKADNPDPSGTKS